MLYPFAACLMVVLLQCTMYMNAWILDTPTKFFTHLGYAFPVDFIHALMGNENGNVHGCATCTPVLILL